MLVEDPPPNPPFSKGGNNDNSDFDLFCLHQALILAQFRRGFCAPNPSVGAVLVKENKIIATGYHHHAGAAHAEIDALGNTSPDNANGATIYVTLEPCCHQGKTPPCTDALIQSGISRVVYAYCDPNPLVAGKGAAVLSAAGISVEHLAVPEINAFYESYHYWHAHKKPFVTAKIAMSLDAKIAGKLGERVQITGEALQEVTHFCRRSSDAILTTAATVIQDDPQMNARCQEEITAKPIYILDTQLTLPSTATLLKTAQSITLFYGKNSLPNNNRLEELINLGLRCVPIDHIDHLDRLDLKQVIACIGQDGIHDLWVEAGGTCFSALIQQQLLQRALVYIAPRLLGEGKLAFPAGFTLDMNSQQIYWQQFGNDVLCDIRW